MRMKPWVAVLIAGLLGPIGASAAAQDGPAYTYRGTVHAVNAKTRTLELITGVGMSLRLVTMRAPSAAPLTNLKPGDVVRADCRRIPHGLVVDRIEKVEVSTP